MEGHIYVKEIDKGKVFRYLSEELQRQLLNTTIALVEIPKGLLTLHETKEVMGMRLEKINLKNTEENRRKYRSLILSTNLSEFISGIVLSEEGLYQKNDEGILLIDVIKEQGIMPGFRGDIGIEKLFGIEGDTITEGLDTLEEKCQKYKEDGCRFATWRSIYTITGENPTIYGIQHTAEGSARFAAICQKNGIAPLIGVEISFEGEYSIEQSSDLLQKALTEIFEALNVYNVFLEGTIIQSTFVNHGHNSKKCKASEIAEATLKVFSRSILASTMGIQILSGGLPEEDATQNLNELFHCNAHRKPWPITFAFGRSLQMSFLIAWDGKTENEAQAKKQLRKRAFALTRASAGKYIPDSVQGCASKSISTQFSELKAIPCLQQKASVAL